ncbi:uncharacterized protein LOC135688275 [Rhopilema esculentum]|uniref:uncharacterized protein LOC135688275 n=1 Tax=Rhopilema esculentum TaxID=499914 RepID=UPI0031DE30F7|eukprot:gene2959-1211_t
MERNPQRLNRDRNDALKRHKSDLIGSRMKAERLKSTLRKLKDEEQKSKLRNDSLIHDFERVNNMAESLETKARKLKKVKQDYETYIHTIYPNWKENLDLSKNSSPGASEKEMNNTSGSFNKRLDKREGNTFNSSGPLHSTAINVNRDSVTDRTLNFSPRMNSNRSGRDHQSINGYNGYEPEFFVGCSSFHEDRAKMPMQYEHYSNGPNQIPASSLFRDQKDSVNHRVSSPYYHNGYQGTGRPVTQNFVNPTHDYSESFSGTRQSRPNILNIPKIDHPTNISDYTILPQALALSPEGQLVLLPMAVSPRMQSFESRGPIQTAPYSQAESDVNITGDGVRETSQRTKGKLDPTSTKLKEKRIFSVDRLESEVPIAGEPFSNEKGFGKDPSKGARSDVRVARMENHDNETELDFRFRPFKGDSNDTTNDFVENGAKHDEKVFVLEEMTKSEKAPGTMLESFISNVSDESLYRNKNDTDKELIESRKPLLVENDVGNQVNLEKGKEEGVKHYNQNQAGALVKKNDHDDAQFSISSLGIKKELVERISEEELAISNVNESHELLAANPDVWNLDVSPPDLLGTGNVIARKGIANNDEIPDFRNHENDSHEIGDKHIEDANLKAENQEKLTEEESDQTTEPNRSSPEGIIEEAVVAVDMPGISHLYEEIEKRMGVDDRKEFYRSSPDSLSIDMLSKIKSELLVEGDLLHFKTPDLCIVSKLVTTEYVKNNSEDGCIVKNDEDLSLVYTLDGFREIIPTEFEELWEYVFNHMELLFGNMIFESTSVCEIFSQILCPGSQEVAHEVSNAIQRIMDGNDEDLYDESEHESIQDEESIESNGDQEVKDHVEDDLISPEQRDTEINKIEEIPSIGSPSKKSDQSSHSDASNAPSAASPLSNNSPIHKGTIPSTKLDESAKKPDPADNSLDFVGSVSDVSDDDDSSTFDSTKLTPRNIPENTVSANDKKKELLDVSSTSDATESEVSLPGLENDEVSEKKVEAKANTIPVSNDDDSDSGEDLEDLLSGSLGRNRAGNGNAESEKPRGAEGAKIRAHFNKKQDSFEVDDPMPLPKKSEAASRKDVFSPENSKSISSKFRKPGFWENSDSESEAGELNISGGNDLSEKKDDDEFDFDFFS